MLEVNGTCVSPYLGDGYDEKASIPAHPGKWPEIIINYRCFTAVEDSETRNKLKLFPSLSPVGAFAELFATKISGWNLKDRKGQAVPVTAKNIGALDQEFFNVLHSYLDGTLPSDQRRASLEAEVKNS